MEPVKFSMREGCHWHLSEILRTEKESGYEGARKKILEFLDDNECYYDYLVDFLDAAFRQECAARMAVFQYLCAQNRICYTKAPAYMDFMPKVYNNCEDLINDRVEKYYLSNDVKNKLAENERLKTACKEWEEMYRDNQETINGLHGKITDLHDTINKLHDTINEIHKTDIDVIITERENRTKSVTDENVTIKFLTGQLAEKDVQIEALMKLLQKQKDTQP